MKHKIGRLLFILKGKTIGWSPSRDAFNYEKYIFKEKVDKKMSKEDLKKQIELLVKDDESNQQTIINQRQQIERLENIIKEAREYIEEMQIWLVDFEDFGITTKGLLEILDKEKQDV